MTLGNRLLQARQRKGFSQRQVAGEYMTRNMLSQLEHDQVTPSLKTLEYLSQVLDVRIGWLLGEEEALPGESPVERARALFTNGCWKDCVSLLESVREQPSEEAVLLYCRALLAYGKSLLHSCHIASARACAEKAEQLQGLYVGSQEAWEAAVLRASCDLISGCLTDNSLAALHASRDRMVSSLQISGLLACWHLNNGAPDQAEPLIVHLCDGSFEKLLLLGMLAMQRQETEAALAFLLEAEKTGSDSRLLLQELYRSLEMIYKQKESYRLAYQYAVLRMEISDQRNAP